MSKVEEYSKLVDDLKEVQTKITDAESQQKVYAKTLQEILAKHKVPTYEALVAKKASAEKKAEEVAQQLDAYLVEAKAKLTELDKVLAEN